MTNGTAYTPQELAGLQAGHHQQVLDLRADHERQVTALEEQYEQRTSALRTMQAELQEEVMRLRSDLSEEMLARQALSAELEDRARTEEDKDRERHEHVEEVEGLRADLQQEKDRAKDLGVRLQEALLDVDGLRNAEQTLLAQLQTARAERSKILQSLSETQSATSALESQRAGMKAELESVNAQLAEARKERDQALSNQSAVAERMMRDHIAETDGDRAILEHQNVELAQQLDAVKRDMEEKLSTAKNAAARQTDGLRAELQFTKAQLKDVQRRETILADELATVKDTTTALSSEKSHQNDLYRDAVNLASKYHETCVRLLNAITSSTTISGSAFASSAAIARPKTPQSTVTSTSGREEMRESVMSKSLAQASAFDVVAFAENVQKTINLVKKWSKSCKTYRDLARNRISFTGFQKGDLALFLPTRNAAAKSWAAFNVSAPHNFLKMTPAIEEQSRTREWIIARIIRTEEAVAAGGESTTTNPFGLADGLRYYVHHVEDYTPTIVRPIRRSISAGNAGPVGGSRIEAQQPDTRVSVSRKNTFDRPEDMATPFTPGQAKSQIGYFPPMSQTSPALQATATTEALSPPGAYPLETDESQPFRDDPVVAHHPPAPPPKERTPLSPVSELPPNMPFARPGLAAISQAGEMARHRTVSRNSSNSQIHPIFSPGSFGRPASVSSSASASATRISMGKTAPIMAVTAPGGSSASPNSFSATSNLPDLSQRVSRRTSNVSLAHTLDDLAPPAPSLPSPSDTATSAVPSKTITPTSPGGFAALGTGSLRLIRGFSVGRKSSSETANAEGGSAKPSAADMLKRLGSG